MVSLSANKYSSVAGSAQRSGQALGTGSPGALFCRQNHHGVRSQCAFEPIFEIARQTDFSSNWKRGFEAGQLFLQKIDKDRRPVELQFIGNDLDADQTQAGVEPRSHTICGVDSGTRELGRCEGDDEIEFGRLWRLFDNCRARLFLNLLSHGHSPDLKVTPGASKVHKERVKTSLMCQDRIGAPATHDPRPFPQ